MKKAALIAFLLCCFVLHTRPASANVPGVAATGVVTVLTSPITGSSSPQAASVGSSLGCTVGGYVEVKDSNPEIAPIVSIPSTTQITAIYQNNHPAGADVICTLAVSAVNPLYGWTTYGIDVTTTGPVQIGPNPTPTQSMYVQGFISVGTAETMTFSQGTGGCTSVTTLFIVYHGAGTPFNFAFVVPPGYYLCFSQSASSTSALGYIDVLQE